MNDEALKAKIEEERKKRIELFGTADGQTPVVDAGHGDSPPVVETPDPKAEAPKLPDLDAMFGKGKPKADAAPDGGGTETELERLRRENAELKMREGSAKGRLEKASTESAQRLQALEAEIADYKAKVAKLEAAGSTHVEDDNLTPEERQLLDDGARGVIMKMAGGITDKKLDKVQREIDAMNARLQGADQMAAANARAAFEAKVLSKVPDLGTFVSESNPQWVGFLKTTVPFGDETFGDVAARAFANSNAERFTQVLEAFKQNAGVSPEDNPSVRTLMRPDSARTPHQPNGAQQPSVYTVAQVKDHWDKWNGGQINKADPKAIALHEDIKDAVRTERVSA